MSQNNYRYIYIYAYINVYTPLYSLGLWVISGAQCKNTGSRPRGCSSGPARNRDRQGSEEEIPSCSRGPQKDQSVRLTNTHGVPPPSPEEARLGPTKPECSKSPKIGLRDPLGGYSVHFRCQNASKSAPKSHPKSDKFLEIVKMQSDHYLLHFSYVHTPKKLSKFIKK